MRNFTLEKTLLAKRAYEKVLKRAGRTAWHYHADNRRFSDKGFHKDIDDKGQEITFCGVGVHHQNGIIENRNKQLTLGAHTLLLYGIRHWPQLVDSLFWQFAMKAMAEQMNSLHVNLESQTPELIVYSVDLETIPVKNFHTLFCPVYVLDHRLQSACGPGPPKWEPRSCIGIYLGHSPFHAGSVALMVFNPKTAQVSPQYHVVFDDNFSTVPYMERGEVPPKWEDLCCLLAESATDESVNLAREWMSGQQMDVNEDGDLICIQDKILNPFGIVTDQYNTKADKLCVAFLNDISTTLGTASEGECDHSLLFEDFGKATAVQVQSSPSPILSDFDAEASEMGKSISSDSLKMPQRVNLHKLGLRCSKQIAKKKSKVQHKAHATYGARSKKLLKMFALICIVITFTKPSHQELQNPSFTHCYFIE
jgi:hypothetical protein